MVQETEALELGTDSTQRTEGLLRDLFAFAHRTVSVLTHQVFLHQGSGLFGGLIEQFTFEAGDLVTVVLVDLAELVGAGGTDAAQVKAKGQAPCDVFRRRNVRDQVLPGLVVDALAPVSDPRVEIAVQLLGARALGEHQALEQPLGAADLELVRDLDAALAVELEQLFRLALVLEERSEVIWVCDLDRAQGGQRLGWQVCQLWVLGQQVLLAKTLAARPEVDLQSNANDARGLGLLDVGNDSCVHVGSSIEEREPTTPCGKWIPAGVGW